MTGRDALLCSTSWIKDVIVNAAQSLLAKNRPNLTRLQDTWVLQLSLTAGNLIHITHTHNAHWVTGSSIGVHQPVIRVCDNLYDSTPTMVRLQIAIASLLQTTSQSIQVEIMNVQKQLDFLLFYNKCFFLIQSVICIISISKCVCSVCTCVLYVGWY